jgi:hypothetical protein
LLTRCLLSEKLEKGMEACLSTLALLYESKGDLDITLASIRKLIDEKSNPAELWLQLYARVLERDGGDLNEFAKVKMLLLDKIE